MTKNGVSTPGSDEAIKAGCTCPWDVNRHGEGLSHARGRAKRSFVVKEDCPLHGIKCKPKEDK